MTASETVASPKKSGVFSLRAILAPMLAIICGMIMVIMDGTIVNVAIPTLVELFSTNLITFQWVITGYTLAMAAVIPVAGWLTDRFGSKRIFLLTIILFTLGSALCSMAQSIEQLIAFRILQGLGGGMVAPIGIALVFKLAPPERRGTVLGMLGIPMLVAPALGPILSGWLMQEASWHWIFLINVPVGTLALLLGHKFLVNDKGRNSHPLDYVGVVLAPIAFALLTYGLSESGNSWSSSTAIAALAAGGVLLLLFIIAELRHPYPLLELRVFRSSPFNRSIVMLWIVQITLFGTMLLIPMYLQNVRGITPFESGLMTLAHALAAGIANPFGGRMFDRIGIRPLAFIGLSLIAAALFILTSITTATDLFIVIVSLILLGLGTGFTMMPLNTHILSSAPPHLVSRVTPLTTSTQQIVISFGAASLAGYLTSRIAWHQSASGHSLKSEAMGFADTFLLAACIASLCVGLSLFLGRPQREQIKQSERMKGE
ncbi:MDR family MFS transporter [Paenibacillus harenae]|uniref:EmrB/QacA subfamily drug resistance transporter n=1 Tax=Paenibacillus harenae TaxID=306543 RepID=A0ABT9U3I0_PAEHA|nr:MDR family MFS transporter [Paenibacillus harenae]MDQ0114199.1 EmrB/QacA subfamily drug resistance transporter [Paenibacillus harenae]